MRGASACACCSRARAAPPPTPHTGGPERPPARAPRPAALQVSIHVARAVAQTAYEGGFATDMPKPHSLVDKARAMMYNPVYRTLR